MEENNKQTNESKTAIMVIIASIAVVAIVAVVVLLIPKQPATTQPANDTADSAKSETPSNSDAATITFTDEGFSPSTLTVKKGTVVTVKNTSATSVQFSSDDHPAHTENPEMNMSELAPGASGTFTADTVGTHGFHDHIDDSKTGTLIVTE